MTFSPLAPSDPGSPCQNIQKHCIEKDLIDFAFYAISIFIASALASVIRNADVHTLAKLPQITNEL